MQAFCIPTEGDNDADAHTHDDLRPRNDPEAALILDSLREASMGGLEALQARFRAIPNSPTKAAVWAKHQGELKAVAAAQHMPEVPAFPKVAA
jgi:hypothetical protein